MPPETHALPHPPLGSSSATEQVSALLSINGNAQINGGHFTMVNHNNVPTMEDSIRKTLGRLREKAAITALYNAGNLPDGGRCHPDTRTTILQELFQFIQDDLRTRLKRILWLSGPAGSGKTTIARTLAYLCDERNVDQASFFFCRFDMTRNGISPLVPTLAYQLACRYPSVATAIHERLIRWPHVFELSLQQQFDLLIVEPLVVVTEELAITCVIDGLDECESSSALDAQSDAVQTLFDLVNKKNCPVLFIVSSRPEANLRMAFNRIGHSISRIYLDNTYEPTKDILQFVTGRFADIKRTHPLAHLLPVDWPRQATINAIVIKSSGQFIYAATVMRFVSSPWAHPDTSLRNIMDSLSAENTTLPFAELDAIFSFILRRASKLRVLLDILTCHLLSRDLNPGWFSLLLETLGYSVKTIHPFLLDIASLVDVETDRERIVLFNESLSDFLLDARRANNLHIDLGAAARDILRKVLSTQTQDKAPLMVDYLIALLPKVMHSTSGLDTQIVKLSQIATKCFSTPFLTALGLHRLLDGFRSLYFLSNPQQYETLLNQWITWWLPANGYRATLRESLQLPGFRTAINSVILSWDSRIIVRDFAFQNHVPYCKYPDDTPPEFVLDSTPRLYLYSSLGATSHRQYAASTVELISAYRIAQNTGMSFADIADYLGYYDLPIPQTILTELPQSTIQRYSDADVLFSECTLGPVPDISYATLKALATTVAIALLDHSTGHSGGNLFGNLGGLFTFINEDPSDHLTTKLCDFAHNLCGSTLVHPHVIDYVSFLDGVVHMHCKNSTDMHIYNELLPCFVQYWASHSTTLDAQFLDIPQFEAEWIKVVQRRPRDIVSPT